MSEPIATPEPSPAPQSNNSAMRLDIAKHALQGILACSDWNKLIAQAAKELGQTMQDVAAEEAASYADALIRKLEAK